MNPTMQIPTTSWNPETNTVRSNGMGRQMDIPAMPFVNPIGVNPFMTNPYINNPYVANPLINNGWAGTPFMGTTPFVNTTPFAQTPVQFVNTPYGPVPCTPTTLQNTIPFAGTPTINPFVTTPGVNPFINTMNPYAAACNPLQQTFNPFVNTVNPYAAVCNPLQQTINPFVNAVNPYAAVCNPLQQAINPFVNTVNPYAAALGTCATTPFGQVNNVQQTLGGYLPTVNPYVAQTVAGLAATYGINPLATAALCATTNPYQAALMSCCTPGICTTLPTGQVVPMTTPMTTPFANLAAPFFRTPVGVGTYDNGYGINPIHPFATVPQGLVNPYAIGHPFAGTNPAYLGATIPQVNPFATINPITQFGLGTTPFNTACSPFGVTTPWTSQFGTHPFTTTPFGINPLTTTPFGVNPFTTIGNPLVTGFPTSRFGALGAVNPFVGGYNQLNPLACHPAGIAAATWAAACTPWCNSPVSNVLNTVNSLANPWNAQGLCSPINSTIGLSGTPWMTTQIPGTTACVTC